MTYEQYDSLFLELRSILTKEGIEIEYTSFEGQFGDFYEGLYSLSSPKTIFIGDHFKEKSIDTLNHEPLIIAHELGHYFDLQSDLDTSVSTCERERRANSYMIEIARRHGLESEALKEAKSRLENIK